MKPALTLLILLVSVDVCRAQTIPVTGENFARAESAFNYANWAKLGADKAIFHYREPAPTGDKAPTVRMNWDTLYSCRIVKVSDDKTFTVHLPEGELYVSAHVVDENGFAPYYIIEKGKDLELKVDTDYAWVLFRTEILDRTSEESLKKSHATQDKIKVMGMMKDSTYTMPNYDLEQLEALRNEYKEEWLKAGGVARYAKGPGRVDQHTLNLSHAAGWGGMEPELNVSNAYFTSETMSGDVPRSITFEDPKNKFFTSFTLYDEDGWLMEGATHINSKMWKPNPDGTITIHFNAGKDAINNLSSGGKPFNYAVRNYGVSQNVFDGKFKPLKPEPVED
jgi:hypothetical protein